MQRTVSVPSLDKCDDLIHTFRDLYQDRKVFAFHGELGAGKTTLIKVLCQDLGVTDEMSSPSFGLVNAYSSAQAEDIFHFDLYRLRSPRELVDIGWFDYLDQEKIMFIEWPEMAGELLPDDTVDVTINVDPKNQQRTLTITYQP
ncbi:MAG: tRNA (adenosine(37)-N6)-threonylcarbamoyltransferase complex ATPase subunit type 1 TsaE [Flavobacteriales bacterium]|nr:tRNA (adenosine(37)-N6)-threonylcarbamoyltransferase complex ATPase subunit type 1 TsaE [Flavobacteriales bacterium]